MKRILGLIGFVFFLTNGYSQQVEYTTPFVPYAVTYNGSDNPNECWESVDFGLLVETDGRSLFFTLPVEDYERLKETLKDQQVTVQVIYYEEPDYGSGAAGNVQKITHNGVVVYSPN